MRRLLALSLGTGLALSICGGAGAAPLTSATLIVEITGSAFTLPPAVFFGFGVTGTATSNLSATLDAGTAFSGSVATTVPATAAPPITQVQVKVTKNAALDFAGGSTPGAFTSIATLKGFGGVTLLFVPLKIGVVNTWNVGPIYGINVTTISANWTAGTASVTGLNGTRMTATAMGSNGLSPGGVGTLVLVSPVKIITNIAGRFAAFGVLTLTYVPEPGTLGLLGTGVLALAALGRRRQ